MKILVFTFFKKVKFWNRRHEFCSTKFKGRLCVYRAGIVCYHLQYELLGEGFNPPTPTIGNGSVKSPIEDRAKSIMARNSAVKGLCVVLWQQSQRLRDLISSLVPSSRLSYIFNKNNIVQKGDTLFSMFWQARFIIWGTQGRITKSGSKRRGGVQSRGNDFTILPQSML